VPWLLHFTLSGEETDELRVMAGSDGQNIGSRTLRGVLWSYGSYVGGRAVTLVSTAILARVLAPEEFGLVALALIFLALLETVSDLGVTQALVVVESEEVDERAETAFLFSLLLGLVLTLVTAALGPAAASFFDEPGLVALLPALGATFFLRALGSTHYALAQKRIDFRSRTAAEVTDVAVRGLAGIGLALAGAGAWSLVIGYLAGTIALTVVLWAMVPWRPTLHPQRAHLRQLLGFGGTLSAVDVVAAAIANADYIIIGRVLGATSLGLYTLGFRLPELLVLNLSVVIGRVLYPAFAAVERPALRQAFLSSLRYTAMVGLPLAAGLPILAEPLVLLAFGNQWLGAVESMQVLTLYALSIALSIPAGAVFKAMGRANVLLKLALPRLALLVTALLVFVDEGIVAVAACQAVVAALFAVAENVLAARALGASGSAMLDSLWPPLVATAVTAAALLGLYGVIGPSWILLLVGGVAGSAIYLAILWLLVPDALRRLVDMARARPAPSGDLTTVRETDVIA